MINTKSRSFLSFLEPLYTSRYYPWVLWGLGSFLFFSEYFVRTSSSVMVGDLMHAFSVDALGIGAISICFYYPYTVMQIPVGLLMDKYGPGRLLIIMSFVFSLGCFLFASASSLWLAEFARVLMGLSAAFAFVGTLKLVTIWFNSGSFGYLAGLTQALGMLGAAIGEGPVAHLVSGLGWRSAMYVMGLFIFILFILLTLFMMPQRRNLEQGKESLAHMTQSFWQTLKGVIANRQTWYNALFAGLLYAPTLAFGELWGVSYLETVHHFSHQVAAASISWIFLGWALGGPISGMVSDRIKKRKPIFYISACLSMLFMLVILYSHSLSYMKVCCLLFLYGMSNTGLVVSYALSAEINETHETGTTMALTNMASVLLGTCCQPLIGWILVRNWDGVLNSKGIPVYSAEAFQYAMVSLPLVFIVALAVAFFVKETHCIRKSHVREDDYETVSM